MMAIWTKLTRSLRAFRGASAGNVAITFALASLPIVGTVGFAVDYSHANSVKAAMQSALDSTALMLAKDAATTSNGDLQTKALNYFKALFTRPEATNIKITASYTASGGSKVVVNGSAAVPTAFLGVIGYNSINVNGSSTTAWGSTRLRVALVLDNTGSMASDGKMTALKSAAKSLLTQLQGAVTTLGDVYVSIIPFTTVVNVGSANYNSAWIDWSGLRQTARAIVQVRPTGRRPYARRTGRPGLSHSWSKKSSWTGCVTDRGDLTGPNTANYDTNVTAPGSVSASKYPAVDYTIGSTDYCLRAVAMGLHLQLVVDVVSHQQHAAQRRYQPEDRSPDGLEVTGRRRSVRGAAAKDSNYTYQQIIILLSDGLNTQRPMVWQRRQHGSSTTHDRRAGPDLRQRQGARRRRSTPSRSTRAATRPRHCCRTARSKDKPADPSKFYVVTSSSGIAAVFNPIGTNLTQLRVAK